MVASVPELVNRTRSSRKRRHSSSANRTAGSVVTANCVPDRAAPSMAATIADGRGPPRSTRSRCGSRCTPDRRRPRPRRRGHAPGRWGRGPPPGTTTSRRGAATSGPARTDGATRGSPRRATACSSANSSRARALSRSSSAPRAARTRTPGRLVSFIASSPPHRLARLRLRRSDAAMRIRGRCAHYATKSLVSGHFVCEYARSTTGEGSIDDDHRGLRGARVLTDRRTDRRQGPQDRRARPGLEPRHRGGVDRPRLQPGRDARLRHLLRRHLQSPAVMLLAFVPMLFIAAAYYYLNRADPDCGTTFTWVTRAIGPKTGWLAGWGILVTDLVVMPNLASIAGVYTFSLFGAHGIAANSSGFWVTFVGVVWIVVMTAICYIGIELSARDPGGAARRRDRHPRRLRRRGAGQGVRRRHRPQHPPVVRVARIPSRSIRSAPCRPGCSWPSSSTGAGTPPSPSTRRPRTPGARRAAPPCCPPSCSSLIYVIVVHRRPVVPRRRTSSPTTTTTSSNALGDGRARLTVGQAAHHRRAHLGVGVDPDHHPAGGPILVVDGRAQGVPPALRRHPPQVPVARLLDADLRGDLDRLVRGARPSSAPATSWPTPSRPWGSASPSTTG